MSKKNYLRFVPTRFWKWPFVLIFSCLAVWSVSAEAHGEAGSLRPSSGAAGIMAGDVSSALSRMDEARRPSISEMTPEDEYYLGRAVAAEILNIYKPYTSDPALVSYLNKICAAITVNSSRPSLFSGYHVEILDTDEICAFSTPGGHILMSRGLISCAGSEDALAAVIAHEAAHIQLRHALAVIQRERMVQELSAAMDRAASIASGYASPEERALLFRASVSASVNTLFKNGYSREQEFEADKAAALLLEGAGYDPSALAVLLGVLDRTFVPASSSGKGSINGTHPSPVARIVSLGRMSGGRGGDTLSARKPRFDTAVKDLQ